MEVATRWGHLEVGALVADANGNYWRVLEKRVKLPQIAYLITDGGQTLWTVHGYDDDVVLIDEEAGRSTLVVQSVMPGAQVIVEPLPKGPDKAWVRAKYHAHLGLMHGYPTTEQKANTLQGLIELHALLHARAERPRINHVHEEVAA